MLIAEKLTEEHKKGFKETIASNFKDNSTEF